MFIFVVVVGITYSYVEVSFLPDNKLAEQGVSSIGTRYGVRVPFFVFLLCALVALPYLWGYYGLTREYPLVQFLAKDQAFFCDLVGKQTPLAHPSCDREFWEVINLGKERAILRRVVGSKIYVVPASSLTTFSIFGKDQKLMNAQVRSQSVRWLQVVACSLLTLIAYQSRPLRAQTPEPMQLLDWVEVKDSGRLDQQLRKRLNQLTEFFIRITSPDVP